MRTSVDQREEFSKLARSASEGSSLLARSGPSLASRTSLPAVLALVCVLSICSIATAQAADDDDEVAVAPREERFVVPVQSFELTAFGSGQAGQVAVVRVANGQGQVEVTSPSIYETEFRKRMETTVASEIHAVDRTVSLTESQKKKLQLAARGDIAQHISRAADLRPKLTSQSMPREQYDKLSGELQRLRMIQQSGLFGEDSLFRKTLRHTLTPEQSARYRSLERERQSRMIKGALVTLGNLEWSLKVEKGESLPDSRQANRQRFVDELLTHGDLPRTQHTYIHYIVLLEIGRLEDRLKPLVTEESWQKLQTKVIEARRLAPALRNREPWPLNRKDDDDEPKELR
jgi:hypothetical protein